MIRTATQADAGDLAKIQVLGWQHAFKNIISPQFLAEMDVKQKTERWREIILNPPKRFHIKVGVGANVITGFSGGGASRSQEMKDYDGELWAIYVTQEMQGQGLGKKLFHATFAQLKEDGFKKMILWCLQKNTPSLQFYRALGGIQLGGRSTKIGEETHLEIGFGWDLC